MYTTPYTSQLSDLAPHACCSFWQMGLRMPIYWLVQYLWCYLLYCFVAAFLIIAGWVFRTQPRSHSSPPIEA